MEFQFSQLLTEIYKIYNYILIESTHTKKKQIIHLITLPLNGLAIQQTVESIVPQILNLGIVPRSEPPSNDSGVIRKFIGLVIAFSHFVVCEHLLNL